MMEAMKAAVDNLQRKTQTKLYLICFITTLVLLVFNDIIILSVFRSPDLGGKLTETEQRLLKQIDDQTTNHRNLLNAEIDQIHQLLRKQVSVFSRVIGDQRIELYEAINEQLIKAEEELKAEKAKIYKEIDSLKEHGGFGEAEEVLKKIREVDVNRAEAIYTFEFDNMTAFLESEFNERRASEYFFARSIKWYLGIETATKDKKKYLTVLLYAHNPSESHSSWSVNTKFEITLLNEDTSLNLVDGFEEKFQKSQTVKDSAVGWNEFVEISELTERGFLKNDRIRLQIHLTAEPLKRTGFSGEDRI